MKRSLIAIGIMALLLLGFSQGDPLELQFRALELKLEHAINVIVELTERVERLEARISKERPDVDDSLSPEPELAAATTPNVIQIDAIRTLPDDHLKIERADRLDKRALKLEQEAEGIENSLTKFGMHQKDMRIAARALMNRLLTEAKTLQTQARGLRQKAKEPRLLVTGWNGSTTVFLRVPKQRLRVIEDTEYGGFLEWEGRVISVGEKFRHIRVTKLKIVRQPEGFEPRPDDEAIPELTH
ncbi:MAG: hypothetical protein O7G85_08325 [Planctomycetota bacterium]|nr:hypothetical protein [Planctomycetota bacterium]